MLEDVFDETAHIGTHLYTRVFRDYIMGFLAVQPINCKIFCHTFFSQQCKFLENNLDFPQAIPCERLSCYIKLTQFCLDARCCVG